MQSYSEKKNGNLNKMLLCCSSSLRRQRGLDFTLYDSALVQVSGNKAKQISIVFQTFDYLFAEMKDLIPQALIGNIKRCRYSKSTLMRKYTIQAGLVGRDVVFCAQTALGKTAAFLA